MQCHQVACCILNASQEQFWSIICRPPIVVFFCWIQYSSVPWVGKKDMPPSFCMYLCICTHTYAHHDPLQFSLPITEGLAEFPTIKAWQLLFLWWKWQVTSTQGNNNFNQVAGVAQKGTFEYFYLNQIPKMREGRWKGERGDKKDIRISFLSS